MEDRPSSAGGAATARLVVCAGVAVACVLAPLSATGQQARESTTVNLANVGDLPLRVGALDIHFGFTALGGTQTDVVVCPDLGPGCNSRLPPAPYRAKITYFAAAFPLEIGYGLTNSLAVELRLPFGAYASRPAFYVGTRLPMQEDIHHQPERQVGISDPALLFRYAQLRGHFLTTARFGVTLPFGTTVPNPYVLASEGLWHQHLQSGSGTVEPIIGVSASYSLGVVSFDARATSVFAVSADSYGFREPTQLLTSLRSAIPLFERKFVPFASVDMPVTGPSHWSVLPPGYVDPPAHAVLLVGSGFYWLIRKPIYWDFSFRIRVANIGPGPSYPGTWFVGIGGHFDGPRAEQGPPEAVHQY